MTADEGYRSQLRKHIAAIDGRRPQDGHSERGFSTCPHPDCVAFWRTLGAVAGDVSAVDPHAAERPLKVLRAHDLPPSGLPPVDAQGEITTHDDDANALTRNGKTEPPPTKRAVK